MNTTTKVCVDCGCEFIPKRSDKKYCSNKCIYTHFRRSRKFKREIKNCAHCGVEYIKTRPSHNCCSFECGRKITLHKYNTSDKRKETSRRYKIKPEKQALIKSQAKEYSSRPENVIKQQATNRRRIELLADWYVKELLKFQGIHNPPQNFINVKRKQIKLKRLCQNQ